jgi:hypothetical protein
MAEQEIQVHLVHILVIPIMGEIVQPDFMCRVFVYETLDGFIHIHIFE